MNGMIANVRCAGKFSNHSTMSRNAEKHKTAA